MPIDVGYRGIPGMCIAIIEFGPFENGKMRKYFQEKFVWELEYWATVSS